MFKVSKLKQVNNEKVNITLYDKTLSFEISGDNYALSFDLNCHLDKLLEIPMEKTIDFNKYILPGETWFNVDNLNGIEPEIDVKITRFLKNKYIIYLTFNIYYSYNDNEYSGIIEFTFDLDDYL